MESSQTQRDILMTILEIIYENSGISDTDLRQKLSEKVKINDKERIDHLRSLNNSKYIKIKQNPKGEIVYFYQDPKLAATLDKLNSNQRTVYEAIKNSGNKGLSKYELKARVTISNTSVLNSTIRELEKMVMIKSFKAKNKTRNTYILAELEPDVELVGGELYEKGQLNHDLIEAFFDKIEQFIASSDSVSKYEIKNFVLNSSESGKNLNDKDIDKLINVLILDDRIEDVSTIGMPKYVVSRNRRAFKTKVIESLPCLSCPVRDECRPGYKISPENCVYFDDW